MVYLFRGTNRDGSTNAAMSASWSWLNVDLMKLRLPQSYALYLYVYTQSHTCMATDISTYTHLRFRSQKCTCSHFGGVTSKFIQRTQFLCDWLAWRNVTCSVMRCHTCQVPISFTHIDIQAAKCQAVTCVSFSEAHSKQWDPQVATCSFISCICY